MVYEKSHTARLSVNGPISVYTRLANRLVKECEEALGFVPEEVSAAAETIKARNLIEEMEDEQKIPREYWSGRVYKSGNFEWKLYSCQEDLDYVFVYYFFRSEVFDANYCGVIHRGMSYDEIQEKIFRQKGPIRYFCMHRPPSPGGIPAGFVTYEPYGMYNRPIPGAIGEVTYNAPPPAEELHRWGLHLDPDWVNEWSYNGFRILHPLDNKGMEESEANEFLEKLAQRRRRKGKHPDCPRCGRRRLGADSVKSRYADVMICGACGIHEAGLDAIQKPMLLGNWRYIQRIQVCGIEVANYELDNGELCQWY